MPLSIMTKAHEDSIKTVKTWRAEKFPTPVRHRWSHKRANKNIHISTEVLNLRYISPYSKYMS